VKNWKFWLGVAVSLVFIYIAVLQIKDRATFFNSLRAADWRFVLLMIAGYMLVFALRTVRWQFILSSVAKPSLASTFIALVICYMGNNIFPLRAGEVLRVYVLNRRHQIPISSGLATVVVERLADVISMLIFMGVLMLTLNFPPEYRAIESAIHKGGILAVVSTLALLVFLYGLYIGSSLVERMVERLIRVFPARWQESIKGLLKSFVEGLHILGKPARLLYLLLLSLAVWLVNLLPVYFVGLSFHWHISSVGCLLLLCLGAVAASIPAAPGFWGTFHYLTSQGLAFLGFGPQETAMSYAIVLHAGYYFPVILLGAILAWREGYSLTSVKQAEQEIKSTE
jgi:hypothetical protein